jgi:hypothetical protein
MAFEMKIKNPLGTLKDAAEIAANIGLEKTQEVMTQINSLLKALQSAGYGVDSLDVELNLPPKVTVKLKTTPALKEEKLTEILRDHPDEKVIVGVIASLIQANKLRASITVETLALEGVEITLTASPNITLQWKDRAALAA